MSKEKLATRHFGAGGLKPGSRRSRLEGNRLTSKPQRLVFSALTQRVRFYGSGPDFLDLSAGHFNGPAQSVGSLEEKDEKELPGPWRQIQSAIWLIGLAILAWQGWWWPGILVLVAISGLTQALIGQYLTQTTEKQALVQTRELGLPENCPNCGGPIDATKVKWTGNHTAVCPFCGAKLKAIATSKTNLPN